MAKDNILYHNVLRELYEKEKKHFKIYTKFRPNPKAQPITGKFYSSDDRKIVEANQDYVDLIARANETALTDKLTYPETVNQEYGWYTRPLIDKDVSDRRLHHGRLEHPDTKTEVIIRKALTKK